ncbi:MAG: hypothetical protein HKO95_16625 [Rhodobacteraceae bacterium]|jgi:hypothetical protein|nr:hypothetical protein [Alphaproteobacteria bacterium]NNF73319.1 hypothetical protein [Paracoccaceae bacterium]NNK68351.1 hypothetical protein [Paracoccaceae bacterium]
MTEQPGLNLAFTPPLQARLDSYFLSMGLGINSYTLKQERREILCWLNAKSDAELALMGLARPEIPAFVFRDLFGA